MREGVWRKRVLTAKASPLVLSVFLSAGCATHPPEPTAQPGTVAFAQQSYSQKLQQCQEAHLGDAPADAGIGMTQTASDGVFNSCVAQANKDLNEQMVGWLSDAGSTMR